MIEKNIAAICASAVFVWAAPAFADPQVDADYIVSQTLTQPIFEGAINAQRPLIIGAVQNELSAKGIALTDPDRFLDLFMEEFIAEFTQSMRDQSASIFIDNFSEQELSDIATFLASTSGQAYLAATPKLMMAGAQMGEQAGQVASENAGTRLAHRIEAEGLIVVDDPSLLSRLLDALR